MPAAPRRSTIAAMRPPDAVPLRFARGTLLAWDPPPRPRVRTAAWHACPFALRDEVAHVMMLDAGRETLADRLATWLEETFP